jgi:peroxiredoxin-like protein
MEIQYRYQASASWAPHRRGYVMAEKDAPRKLDFAVPPEFGGEEGFWTPEHLLLAAVASCYVATFRSMAGKSNVEFQTIDITVEGVIEKAPDGLRFTKIFLRPELLLTREADRERASRLLEKAEQGCLIARSLSGELELHAQILIATPLEV